MLHDSFSDRPADAELEQLVSELFGADAVRLLDEEFEVPNSDPRIQIGPQRDDAPPVKKPAIDSVPQAKPNPNLTSLQALIETRGQRLKPAQRAALLSLLQAGSQSRPVDIETRYLLVETVGRMFALPLRHVAEVLTVSAVTPLPRMPAWFAGIIHHRGQMLSVLDLVRLIDPTGTEAVPVQKRFAQPHRSEQRLVVLKSLTGEPLALRVERFVGQRELVASRFGAVSAQSTPQPFISGICQEVDRSVLRFDPEALFHSELLLPYRDHPGSRLPAIPAGND